VLVPDPETRELTLTATHTGVTLDRVRRGTGWSLKVSDRLETTPEPTAEELRVLRDLHERTARAHGTAGSDE
jgi:glutaconate CoA-transferase, subunit B